jgi:membrane protease subunit (stomatin/prohibitin family)
MGFLKSFTDAASSTLADQWKDIFTAGHFGEHVVVAPGIQKNKNNDRGENYKGSDGVISNGSEIFVPENTAAFIFSKGGIELIITEPGEYVYDNGEESVFEESKDDAGGKRSFLDKIIGQTEERFTYGGIPVTEDRIAFVNLREIRGIPFGTKGPQVYHDKHYECDLEIYAYGTLSVRVTNPERFIRNFVPANVYSYSFDDLDVRKQVITEFVQSFIVALNSLSKEYQISELPSQANKIELRVLADEKNAGSWEERFGFKLISVGIENIEFTEQSRELVNSYSSNRMNVAAYEGLSSKAGDMAAQQKIAEGIKDNGLGDGAGGMLLGMNIAQSIGANASSASASTVDQQIETLKKLKELVDIGVLTQEEFEAKKKEVMEL